MTKKEQNVSNNSTLTALQRSTLVIKKLRERLDEFEKTKVRNIDDIAIVGMDCRYPGGIDSLEKLWNVLHNGIDAITEVPKNRWDADFYFNEDPLVAGKISTKYGGFIDDVSQFDASLFGITPKEATLMDPQQRILLEVVYSALEDAGINPKSLLGSKTGVFVGLSMNDYAQHQLYNGPLEKITAYDGTGNGSCFASGRVSHFLGVHGPSITLDTACSSSLTSIHLAKESLLKGEIDLAIAGGVHINLDPRMNIFLSQARCLASDGRCKTFSENADGFGRSEGCGIVILKRLKDVHRDNIVAVIKGSALNHDGRSSGLTVPSELAQEMVIHAALSDANVSPEDVDYVEAHGTGTKLGDPIEINALSEVYCRGRKRISALKVGSIKSNFGHAEAAAGVAGVIKVSLALKNQILPKHLLKGATNPLIDWNSLGILVNDATKPWPYNPDRIRTAAVSSFGMSGNNAHFILADAKTEHPSYDIGDDYQILKITARTPKLLNKVLRIWHRYLNENKGNDNTSFAQICATANIGRSDEKYRLCIVSRSTSAAANILQDYIQQQSDGRSNSKHQFIIKTNDAMLIASEFVQIDLESNTTSPDLEGNIRLNQRKKSRKIAFIFSGQGAQYAGMAKILYQSEPVFKESLDQCETILAPYSKYNLKDILFDETLSEKLIDETYYTQPAIIAVEIALIDLWKSWRITPNIVLGHSLGEYTAAYCAGIFSRKQLLLIISKRVQSIKDNVEKGSMIAVFNDPTNVKAILQKHKLKCSIAVYNSANNTVVAGQRSVIKELADVLNKNEVRYNILPVSHAFHTSMMQPMQEGEFKQALESTEFAKAKLQVIGNLYGQVIEDEMYNPDYWITQIQEPVQFITCVKTLLQNEPDIIVEISPKPMLTTLVSQIGSQEDLDNIEFIHSLKPSCDDRLVMLENLARIYVNGGWDDSNEINWENVPTQTFKTVDVPKTIFSRKHYWVEKTYTSPENSTSERHPLLGKKLVTPLNHIIYESYLNQDSPFFLADHQIFNKAILPAAGFIEIALAAGAELFEEEIFGICDMHIMKALPLPEANEYKVMQIIVNPVDDTNQESYRFEIHSRDDNSNNCLDWQLHAKGELSLKVNMSDIKISDKTQNYQKRDVEQYYSYFSEKLNTQYGDNFKGIDSLYSTDGLAFGKIKLPSALLAESHKYNVHPVLLDSALQMLRATFPGEDRQDAFLPIYVKQIAYKRQHFYKADCEVTMIQESDQKQETYAATLSVFGDKGPVLYINEMVLKRLEDASLLENIIADKHRFLYQQKWYIYDNKVNTDISSNHDEKVLDIDKNVWVIFSMTARTSKHVQSILSSEFKLPKDNIYIIDSGSRYQKINNNAYKINYMDNKDIDRCLTDIAENSPLSNFKILTLNDLDRKQGKKLGTTLARQSHLILRLFNIVKGVLNSLTNNRVQFNLVTNNAEIIQEMEEPSINLEQTTLISLVQSLATEHTDIDCRTVDIDSSQEINKQLVSRFLTSDFPSRQAIRNGQTWVPKLVSITKAKRNSDNKLIDSNAIYLITGGLGGIGMELAHYLVDLGATHLFLTSRNKVSPEQRINVEKLVVKGVNVNIVNGDISHKQDVHELFEKISNTVDEYGHSIKLKGVFHLAGIADDAMLSSQTVDNLQKISAPKVSGSWWLHEFSRDSNLDFFVLFSSIGALTGAPGQTAYSIGNRFMDSLAHYRHMHSLPATSINWGLWQEVGMSGKLDRSQKQKLKRLGINPLKTKNNFAILFDIIIQGQSNYLVADIDWHKYAHEMPNKLLVELLQNLSSIQRVTSNSVVSNKKLNLLSEILACDNIERQRKVENFVHSEIAKLLEFPINELDTNVPINELGADSIMITDIRNSIQSNLDVDIPVVRLMESITIFEISEYIGNKLKDIHVNMQNDNQDKISLEEFTDSSQSIRTGALLSSLHNLNEEELDTLLDALDS